MRIKNGKLKVNNIYKVKLIYLFLLCFLLTGSITADNINKQWVIVIDPGHGGKDPGAIGSKSREKDITLAIALKTGAYIEQNISNVKVIYTRKTDVTVDLTDRPKIANKNNADLFISIHANWWKNKNVYGAETYIMGHAKDQANLEVAMKENEVIFLEDDYTTKYEGFDPKSPESYIMFTLMQKVFQEQSTNLASKIQTQFRERVNRNDRDVKQAGFWVLFTTKMPSVLVETGFITNSTEEQFLLSSKGQDYLASAIFRACREYIEEIDSKSGISAIKNDVIDTKSATPVQANPTSQEVVFMVQIAASSTRNEIKPESFNGLKNVVEIVSQDRYKYASGMFSEYSEAVRYRKEIEALYPDAFVIAIKDNNILPLQQVLDQNTK